MNISSYLKNTGSSQASFGAQLMPQASQALVSQWVRGVTRITLDYALQIEKVTQGIVSPQDCADMFVPTQNRESATP